MERLGAKSRTCTHTLFVLAMFCSTALAAKAQTLNATSIAFGNVVVQTTSTAKAVILTNTQTVPLTINSMSVSGDFAEASKCPIAPKTLLAGATCQIVVTFAPTVLGGRTGTLTVSDDGPNSPQTAQLSGTGVLPANLSNSSLGFGNRVVNTASAAEKVSLTNYQAVAASAPIH